jgi:Protein of unknown function (DUF4238)
MNHHFVPQFYLRGFCDPEVSEGQEPWIWVADFQEQRIERRAPKNVGKAGKLLRISWYRGCRRRATGIYFIEDRIRQRTGGEKNHCIRKRQT